MATTLTIDGSGVTLSQYNAWPIRLTLRYRGISTLAIRQTGATPEALPDKWLGKPVVLAINGTTRFTGTVVDVDPQPTAMGWVYTYQCRDLRHQGDRVPMTDSNTGTDSAGYNLAADDRDYIASRAGRTVGEIITDVLEMQDNADALDAKGIGNYSSLAPPTLPTNTATDLAAMSLIPPAPCYVQGERLLSAIEAFLSAWAPNHVMWVNPANGEIRFGDMRTFTDNTILMDDGARVEPAPLRRSVAECYSKVIIRGAPQIEPKMVTLSSGILEEDFAWGAYTNTQAKDNYVPSDFERDVLAKSEGTCTCPDTTHVTVDPTDDTQEWTSNYWDQTSTGHLGSVYVYYTAGAGINQFCTRRITANASLSAAGTASLTLDIALPATNYDRYYIYGISNGASLVWRKYSVTDSAIYTKMARAFAWPVPYVGSSGNVAVMTTTPMASVCWSASGDPPYAEFPVPFTQDPSTGSIILQVPSYKLCGNKVPSDVRVMLAINTGSLTATAPASSYEGTCYTVEGIEEALTVTVPSWRDPANQTAMDDYAQDLLDSIKDTIVEGSVTIHDLWEIGLDFAQAVTVEGNGYATPYDGISLPIQEVDLSWNSGQPSHYTTTLHLSNRRAHFSTAAFLKPDRPVGGALIGGDGESFGAALGGAAYAQASAGVFQGLSPEQAANMRPTLQTQGMVAPTSRAADPASSFVANTTGPAMDPAATMADPVGGAVLPRAPGMDGGDLGNIVNLGRGDA